MTDFHSYQAGSDTASNQNIRNTGPQVRNHDTATMVTTVNGEVTERTQGHSTGSTAGLNPYHGTDSIFATARAPNGHAVTEILPSTLVEIDGVQAPVSFWVSEGRLQRAADGTFEERAQQAAPAEAETGDYLPLSDSAMSQVNQALDGVDQGNMDALAGIGTGVATGRLDASSLAHRFAEVSGQGGEAAEARLSVIRGAYQAQADGALSRYGVSAADLPSFYAWAKANQRGQLGDAVQLQLRTHDVSGYRAIAAQWRTMNAPSVNAFKAAGVPVRSQGGKPEVFVQGSWMSPSAAARAGLV